MTLMEATHSSRSSSDEIEYDPKIELAETTTARDSDPGAVKGEGFTHQGNAVAKHSDGDDVAMAVRRKINDWGTGAVKLPELQMSGCSDGEDDTESDDADLCSSSEDDGGEGYDPLASGVVPPVLPDIQLRVPMEDVNDVRRVKDALFIKGVLDVVCDQERQLVTVTGIVPPIRLLKKVRKVKRQARIISTTSPFALFVNPHIQPPQFEAHEELPDDTAPIDIPSTGPGIPNFVVLQQRPRPTFQRFNFHNDPHSPYLRTFSPSDLSPADSPTTSLAPEAEAHRRRDSSIFDEDFCQANGCMFR